MIMADTTFFVAIFVDNDQWHEKALKISDYVENKEKIITNQIISETITMICNKVGAKESKRIYDYLIDNCTIINETREMYDKSMDTLLKYNCKLSLADATSIEIMKKLKIHEIASFDSDFDNKEGIIRIH